MLASDTERNKVLLRLRAAHAHGMLGHETFENRIELTLRAARRSQLSALLADLPDRRTALRDAIASVTRRVEHADGTDVRLPSWNDPTLLVGRSRTCGVQLADETVSAQHAELRPLVEAHRWLLVDLGSLNGTWFLGRRVGRTIVEAGDQVLLGAHAVTLLSP